MISAPTGSSLLLQNGLGLRPALSPNTLSKDLEEVLRALAGGADNGQDPALSSPLKNLQSALGVAATGKLDAETAQALQNLLTLVVGGQDSGKVFDPELASQALRRFQGDGTPNRAPSLGTRPTGTIPVHQLQQQQRPPSRGSADAISSPAAASINSSGTSGGKLHRAMARAKELGLKITSTTGGRHAAHSYHYQGRAVDVSGSPKAMAQFYREMKATNPTELFYDPLGGIKRGREIGAIGGHRDHVHVAY